MTVTPVPVKGGVKAMMTGRRDMFSIPFEHLAVEEGWNIRLDTDELKAHIRWLADDIKASGRIKEPLTVVIRDGLAVVRDGHCRYAAATIALDEGAKLEDVPCKTEDAKATETDMLFGIFIRNGGKPLTPMEQGLLFKRLTGAGVTIAEIASKTSLSEVHVSNLIMLANSDQEVVDFVKEGKVSATLAIEVVKVDGDNAKQTLGEAVGIAKAEGKDRATKKHVLKYAEQIKNGEPILAKPAVVDAPPAPVTEEVVEEKFEEEEVELVSESDDCETTGEAAGAGEEAGSNPELEVVTVAQPAVFAAPAVVAEMVSSESGSQKKTELAPRENSAEQNTVKPGGNKSAPLTRMAEKNINHKQLCEDFAENTLSLVLILEQNELAKRYSREIAEARELLARAGH